MLLKTMGLPDLDVGACIRKDALITIRPIGVFVQVEVDSSNVDAAACTVRLLLNMRILLCGWCGSP